MLAVASLSTIGAPTAARRATSTYMDCGEVKLCGLLTLETGFGSGYYKHDTPSVHGLWPETGSYGSSECVAPSSSSTDPTKLFSCYNTDPSVDPT